MVIVNPRGDLKYYMNEKLKANLDKIKKKLMTKDRDYVLCVDGDEGGGKSVDAMQIGCYIDPTLDLSRVCMDGQSFVKAIKTAKKGQCVIYDEAYSGLSSRGALSEINNIIVSMMMEMRQKNLFVIIVLPTFFMLDKYVAIWRARSLIHVYLRNGRRGNYAVFNKKKKKFLYLHGKKDYNYMSQKPIFRGRFTNVYVVDEKKYRLKHRQALEKKNISTKSDKYITQRNKLLFHIKEEMGYSLTDLAKFCKDKDISLKKTQLHDILKKITRKNKTS